MTFEKIRKSRIWLAIWRFLARTFINLGLPLIAWGFRDIAGFFANPARTALAAAVLVQGLIVGWMVYQSPPRPQGEPSYAFAYLHSNLFEGILILAAFGDRRNILVWDENMALRWTGLAVYLAAAVLFLWANQIWLNHLLREGERAYDNPALLAEGPFRWIRYPTLLCLVFSSLGTALLFRSWAALFLLLPLVGSVIQRSHRLEKDYVSQSPRDWEWRRQNSKRFIPFIY